MQLFLFHNHQCTNFHTHMPHLKVKTSHSFIFHTQGSTKILAWTTWLRDISYYHLCQLLLVSYSFISCGINCSYFVLKILNWMKGVLMNFRNDDKRNRKCRTIFYPLFLRHHFHHRKLHELAAKLQMLLWFLWLITPQAQLDHWKLVFPSSLSHSLSLSEYDIRTFLIWCLRWQTPMRYL